MKRLLAAAGALVCCLSAAALPVPSTPRNARAAASVKWWSFQPIKRPALPAVKDAAWCRTPIDRFILAKLESKGLRPNPQADRRTMIRRVTFDLTGLPPTPEEINLFLTDRSPDAYKKVVDRLLSSPAYGERWGRHWLDLVHYGDTHGYDKDKRRDNAWPYRDYVIKALNDDKPYGRFIEEQVAGDALFGTPEAIAATGMVVAGPWDFVGQVELREGTVEKEKTRVLDRDDMVANVMSTFNSVTIHCARCHNHKFDPITQKDYYRLQAVFAGVERGDVGNADPETVRRNEAARIEYEREIKLADEEAAAVVKKLTELRSPEIDAMNTEIAALREAVRSAPVAPATSPTNGYHSAISAAPDAEKWVEVDLGAVYPLDEVRIFPARPTDFADTPGFGFPARFMVQTSDDRLLPHWVPLLEFSLESAANPGDVPLLLKAYGRRARYIRITAYMLWERTKDFVFALSELQAWSKGKNVALGAPVTSLDSIEGGRWSARYLVDGYDSRHMIPTDPAAWDAYMQPVVKEHALRVAETRKDQKLYAMLTPLERKALDRDRVMAATRKYVRNRTTDLPTVFAVKPRAPRPIYVLARGEVEQPKEEVSPGALSCVAELESSFGYKDQIEGARRAALAKWLSSRKNPLSWRSIVNRVWQYHFGKGIVDTPSDFGRNGSLPSHPELLDWLAVAFRDGGQSLKSLHRQIVMSAAYRQSSANSAAGAKIDADNRLLWRMNRRRLDAEEIRDSVLAVSGRLDRKSGGPGFELFRFKDDHSPIYDHSAIDKINDPATWRRTVYRFTVRSVPNPLLECLDCADPNINTPVRSATITALQALALLNDPFLIRQSEEFARRVKQEVPIPAGRVRQACLLAFGRPPTASEETALQTYATKHGLPNLCRLLYNMNEFVFVD